MFFCELTKNLVVYNFRNWYGISMISDELLINDYNDFIDVGIVIFIESYLGCHVNYYKYQF
jgi:hypothetical protein